MIDRLQKILDFLGLSPSEFADEIDVQRSSMSHLFSGRNKPSLDFIKKIKTTYPEIDTDWLIFGEGEMIKNAEEEHKNFAATDDAHDHAPALFSTETENKVLELDIEEDDKSVETPPESNAIVNTDKTSEKTSESEDLDHADEKIRVKKNVEKIIFFYQDGTFDIYHPS
ncbi:helix-turn-helix domain-containing protein [Vaginella massiliensis]|uniref:helix-turn-helix domain-containing protein n=1 Tax=Vaginella massiliensis TaxID=1816680 RepID=UPI003753D4F8